jgi:hypothetical protein
MRVTARLKPVLSLTDSSIQLSHPALLHLAADVQRVDHQVAHSVDSHNRDETLVAQNARKFPAMRKVAS